MVGQAGLVKTNPPLSYSVANLGVVLYSFTVIILTYKPIGGVEDPAGLRVEVGAAFPIPPEVTPAVGQTLAHLLFIFIFFVFHPNPLLLFYLLLLFPLG